jgi:hypothetical protein
LWDYRYGALFLVNYDTECQAFFRNNFLTRYLPVAGRPAAPQESIERNEDNEGRKFEAQFPLLLVVKIAKSCFIR